MLYENLEADCRTQFGERIKEAKCSSKTRKCNEASFEKSYEQEKKYY